MGRGVTQVAGLVGGFLRALIRAYRVVVSPALAPRCRHLPTCSEYALEALEQRGPVAGLWLTLRRIGRCHPWGTSGYDPVPARPEPTSPGGAR